MTASKPALWLQGETYNQICLLATWVGCNDRNTEGISNLDILGSLDSNIGYCETLHTFLMTIIERGGIRNGTDGSCPVASAQFEWS